MFTRFTTRALPLVITSLVILAVLCSHIGKAQPTPDNPYAALLSTPLNDIYTLSRCYPEPPMRTASYCIRDTEGGYIAFSVGNGAVKYMSVSGAWGGMRVGDLVAIYGQPTRTYRNRFYATYRWQENGFWVSASSRRDGLYELVRWMMVGVG